MGTTTAQKKITFSAQGIYCPLTFEAIYGLYRPNLSGQFCVIRDNLRLLHSNSAKKASNPSASSR